MLQNRFSYLGWRIVCRACKGKFIPSQTSDPRLQQNRRMLPPCVRLDLVLRERLRGLGRVEWNRVVFQVLDSNLYVFSLVRFSVV